MVTRVKEYMAQLNMTHPGDKVLVGLSGGADSVCLLLLLHRLQMELDICVSAVHVEHGIRGEESLADAAFARDLCERLGISFTLFQVDAVAKARNAHMSLEEAARVLRYECYRNICEKTQTSVIALAHHGDDNAETMLFHLSRGTGARGLAGIGPVRRDESGNRIIRPLLCVTRQEIEDWLREQGQSFCVDSTNTDTAYARNRIRSHVLPELVQINEQAVHHMAATADMLREMADYVEEMARLEGTKCICQRQPLRLDISKLMEMKPILRDTFLLEVLGDEAGSRKDITRQHVQLVYQLLEKETGKMVALPYGLKACREYESLIISREMQDICSDKAMETELVIPGRTMPDPSLYVETTDDADDRGAWMLETEVLTCSGETWEIPQNQYTKWFDYDKIQDTVQIRARRQGDYLQVDGSGNHKKINRYFIDAKIPAGRRDRMALVADGSHIMWVPGGRISEGYKVDAGTKRILQIRLIHII